MPELAPVLSVLLVQVEQRLWTTLTRKIGRGVLGADILGTCEHAINLWLYIAMTSVHSLRFLSKCTTLDDTHT